MGNFYLPSGKALFGAMVDYEEPKSVTSNNVYVLEVNERFSVFHLPFAKL